MNGKTSYNLVKYKMVILIIFYGNKKYEQEIKMIVNLKQKEIRFARTYFIIFKCRIYFRRLYITLHLA